MQDTIYAPSTAIGGALAVIRLSGPDCRRIARGICRRDITKQPRMLLYTLIKDGMEPIDGGMAVFMQGPNTYTGEDMLELHCHGGYGTVTAVLGLLSRQGARPAQGGEFTRRAFMNGKMDLSSAEAVMDLIQAKAQGSRRAALEQLQGGLFKRIEGVEELLLEALSGLDAAIDYPEEMEEEVAAQTPGYLQEALVTLNSLIEEGRRAKILREGMKIALIGRPNVGKSSLLNALLGQERAIVTDIPGTTRDILDETVSIGGIPVRLIDTAGIRQGADKAEQIGVDRARAALEQAELVLLLLDGSHALNREDRELIELTEAKKRLILRTKGDLPQDEETFGELTVSSASGMGIEALKQRIIALCGLEQGDGTLTNERHIHALEMARIALLSALDSGEEDCCATDIQEALHHLGAITGKAVDEAVIDRIFARFCVGK